jgi:hypothetical protein
MVRSTMFAFLAVATLLAALPTASAATITGIVTDVSSKPVENARIDHTGKITSVRLKVEQNQLVGGTA